MAKAAPTLEPTAEPNLVRDAQIDRLSAELDAAVAERDQLRTRVVELENSLGTRGHEIDSLKQQHEAEIKAAVQTVTDASEAAIAALQEKVSIADKVFIGLKESVPEFADHADLAEWARAIALADAKRRMEQAAADMERLEKK
jgi:hypothetical protein